MLYAIAFVIGGIVAVLQRPSFNLPNSDLGIKTENVGFCGTESIFDHERSEETEEGKTLFRNNCASCHNKNMRDDMTGPALGGVRERWAAYPKKDLYAFIKGSQKMIQNGHPRAKKLWEEWGPTIMNNNQLTDEEIEKVLVYVEAVYD